MSSQSPSGQSQSKSRSRGGRRSRRNRSQVPAAVQPSVKEEDDESLEDEYEAPQPRRRRQQMQQTQQQSQGALEVFKGQPRDLQSTRVTELYIASDGDERTNVTIRMQGEHPNFRVHAEWNQPLPWTRPNFYRRLAVATFPTTGGELDVRVRDAIWNTPVNNTELDYSCQSWVGDVVTVLQDANLITVEEGDNALNGMVNYISQAPWR
ncbi:hypothetical protein ONZ43_g1296 [Nemania bipapillata]|uniref:Uncharacterized protein n=1 Tax=Nemania bipapillata TaxID=110536 RepID=A0ACC2J517_9PEZI|nr:hypothetical protein ONZ43_g1296 [Nemania bipapillata]